MSREYVMKGNTKKRQDEHADEKGVWCRKKGKGNREKGVERREKN